LIKLAGAHDLRRTTNALDDAATRLSRLFLIQLGLNAAFGIIVGLGLWIVGVPSPVLWGILAAILRFVPYIGAIISAVFPLTLAAAVDPGWSMLMWTGALFLVAEFLIGQVIEPIAFGHGTGLTPVAVVTSATFWTALWGPVGLVLATPLTVCLVVLGRHVERFEFLDIMLGDRPALLPSELFYQRMLAEDPAEAVDKAEEFLKERSLLTYYEEVALPGLRLAQNDLARGALDRAQAEAIKRAVVEVVDDLDEQEDRNPAGEATRDVEVAAALDAGEPIADLPVLGKQNLLPEWQGNAPVICAAGRGPLDEAVAAMLAQLLQKHGLQTRVESADAVGIFNILQLDTSGVAMVCLSYLDVASPAHMRYVIRRLRRRLPEAKIVLGCWLTDLDGAAVAEMAKPDATASTLRQAVKICLDHARAPTKVSRPPPEQTKEKESVRAGAC
jgi:hypothetical protein